jgi:hypothetical protein
VGRERGRGDYAILTLYRDLEMFHEAPFIIINKKHISHSLILTLIPIHSLGIFCFPTSEEHWTLRQVGWTSVQ